MTECHVTPSHHMCMRMLLASVYLHACVRQSGLRRRPAAPGHPSLVARRPYITSGQRTACHVVSRPVVVCPVAVEAMSCLYWEAPHGWCSARTEPSSLSCDQHSFIGGSRGVQTGGKTRVFPVRKSGCALLFSSYLESDSVRQMAAGKI